MIELPDLMIPSHSGHCRNLTPYYSLGRGGSAALKYPLSFDETVPERSVEPLSFDDASPKRWEEPLSFDDALPGR